MSSRKSVVGLIAALVLSAACTANAQAPGNLQQVKDFWIAHGATPQVALAWAAEVNRESGGDPTRIGDGGTSLGAYQHHASRANALLLNIENNQAFQELMGDDPIAAAHRDEIMTAPTEAAARAAIKNFFFRPAGSVRHTQHNRRQATTTVVSEKPSAAPAADVQPTNSDPFSSNEHDRDSSFLITQEVNQ